MTYGPRVREAINLALELHGNQERKCSGVPYITHLFAVAALVGEYGGDEDQFIAALLHDAVEDQGGQAVLERIRSRFGETVAKLVWGCTDAWEQPKPPWRQRKEAHIARIPEVAGAARLVIAADKIHNLRSMTRTYTPEDDAGYWRHFRGGREGTLWYYAAMREAVATGWNHPILEELSRAEAEFREYVGE